MKQKNHQWKPIAFAVLSAGLFALNAPFSKLLLSEISPTMLAALLYLGAGIGIGMLSGIRKLLRKTENEQELTKRELPYVVLMIALDIAAPILLMFGLTYTTAENTSLLSNFEIVATSLIALFVFKEKISGRLWIAISLVTVSSLILSFQNASSLSFSFGSLFVVLSCICWGAENNCTKMLSNKKPSQIVVIKGLFSGTGSFIIALTIGEHCPSFFHGLMALSLGFVAYGLSISFYIYAQRYLGAAKTSAYYALAPFIGAFLSLFIFREKPSPLFLIALIIMAAGTYFVSIDTVRGDSVMSDNNDISFDHRADKYDNGFEGRLSERFYRNLISSVHVSENDSVLDVGCGTGTILYRLAAKSKINGFGIDVSSQMLDEARKKCPEMTFQLGDSASLPFADGSFDVVTACMAYHHFPNQKAFRQEVFRVLKPTGKLYICDPCLPLVIRKCMNGIFSMSKIEARFYTPDEMIQDVQKDGFVVDNVIIDSYVQVVTFKKQG